MRASFVLLTLVFASSAVFATTAAAQQPESDALPRPRSEMTLSFQRLTPEDGLSQGTIYDIYQDDRGFMWFATGDGLNRFDGYDFKVYKTEPFDTTSLSDTFVYALAGASDGGLWVGTGSGLDYFDPSTGKATSYSSARDTTRLPDTDVGAIKEASDGFVWVGGTNGLYRLDPETRAVRHYKNEVGDPNSLSNNIIHSIHESADGVLWIGTGNGLNRFDRDAETFTRYLTEQDGPAQTWATDVRFLTGNRLVSSESEPDVLWVPTGNGLVKLHTQTGEHTRYQVDPDDPSKNGFPDVARDPVDANVLWLSGYGSGLYRFDIGTETFEVFQHDPRDPSSLGSNMSFRIQSDRTGSMWVGHMGAAGISRFDPQGQGFSIYRHVPGNSNSLSSNHVWSVYEAPSQPGIIWVGADLTNEVGQNLQTVGVLNRIDRRTGEVRSWRSDRLGVPGRFTSGMYEDSRGQLWIGVQNGLCLMDRRSETFTCYRHDPSDSTSIPAGSVMRITERRAAPDTLWIGSLGGFCSMPLAEPGRFDCFEADPADSTSLVNHATRTFLEDSQGRFWIGTSGGLCRMSPSGDAFECFAHDPTNPKSVSNSTVTSIAESPLTPDVLWVGTYGGGLNRFDTQSETFTYFTEKNSDLINNAVYSIVVDDDGTLWMSTNRGLARYDPQHDRFTAYDSDDGLQGLEFSEGSSAVSTTGEIFFGGTEGLTVFNPDDLDPAPLPPEVALTNLRVDGEEVDGSVGSPLRGPIHTGGEIRLGHDARTISFDFVALHYKNPEKNQYAYMLEGFDDDWVEAGPVRSATYTNLPPGRYNFRVKAANSDGVWNEEGAMAALTVLPPWWQTTWAYVVYGLLFAGGIFMVDRIQRRRVQEKEREKARQRELEQARELKEAYAQLERSHAIVAAINAETELEALLDAVLRELSAVPGVDKASALIYDEGEDAYVFTASLGWDVEELRTVRMSAEEAEARYVNPADQVSDDIFLRKELEKLPGDERIDSLGIPASLLVMRMRTDDRVDGYLVFDSMENEDAFDESDVALLENLREHVRSAFVKTRLLEQLRRSLDHLTQTQAQLVQQEKMASLGQLTAGIAHEIKNPLNFVNNFASVSQELVSEAKGLLESLRGERKVSMVGGTGDGHAPDVVTELHTLLEDLRTNAEKIEEHGRRADGIVRSMLEHSRGSRGEKRRVKLNDFVDDYVNLAFHGMRAQVSDFNVEIEREYDDGAGEIDVVPQELGRVLVNLFGNAFDAVHERKAASTESAIVDANVPIDYEPRVRVSTRRNGEAVEIRVEDNGPGIPREARKRIFEPFYTTKPTGKGTGLGLSLSYEIVTQGHGGKLRVDDIEAGGAAFVVELPAR